MGLILIHLNRDCSVFMSGIDGFHCTVMVASKVPCIDTVFESSAVFPGIT